MKKLAILLGAVVMSGTLLAQKPSSDDSNYSLEGMINYSDMGFEWNAPNLRMRYFVNDNIAARVTLGLASDNTTMNVYEAGGDGTGTVDMSNMGWSLGLGAEYHLGGTDRLSPFFSAGFSIGGNSYTEEWSNSDGVDYYVASNIYLGLEMGFGFGTSTDNGGTVTVDGTSSDIDATGSASGMSIGGGNMGFRIGWRF